ncbi:hypothetical protein [Flocculibacter collagenilyticus]|uniref:hypothetical protein n=1 Tax=Flocculibacter collagenilyticus TaxID=2744479 RepID=UPI0018F70CF5|nr:hypothetical protein [Flocculibacter collagenilyticus]
MDYHHDLPSYFLLFIVGLYPKNAVSLPINISVMERYRSSALIFLYESYGYGMRKSKRLSGARIWKD